MAGEKTGSVITPDFIDESIRVEGTVLQNVAKHAVKSVAEADTSVPGADAVTEDPAVRGYKRGAQRDIQSYKEPLIYVVDALQRGTMSLQDLPAEVGMVLWDSAASAFLAEAGLDVDAIFTMRAIRQGVDSSETFDSNSLTVAPVMDAARTARRAYEIPGVREIVDAVDAGGYMQSGGVVREPDIGLDTAGRNLAGEEVAMPPELPFPIRTLPEIMAQGKARQAQQ